MQLTGLPAGTYGRVDAEQFDLISLLPPELLESIVQIACEQYETDIYVYDDLMLLSLVSTRFSSVAAMMVKEMKQLPPDLTWRLGPKKVLVRFPKLAHLRINSRYFDEDMIPVNARLLTLAQLHQRSKRCRITFQSLQKMCNLTSLDASFWDSEYFVNDTVLAELRCLTHLNLKKSRQISDLGLTSLADTLLSLNLEDNRGISDDGLSVMTNLTSLRLTDNVLISDRSVSVLTALTSLKLDGTRNILSDESLSCLLELRTLVPSEHITDAGLEPLANLTNLRANAALSGSVLAGKQLSKLRLHKRYRNLRIANGDIARQTSLTVLTLCADSTIGDDGVAGLTSLKALDCNRLITDVGLHSLTNLTRLSLTDPHPGRNDNVCTDASVSRLINLRVLILDDHRFVTDCALSCLTNLRELYLCRNPIITDSGISGLTNLRVLDVQKANKQITVNGLKSLFRLRRLSCDPRLDCVREYLQQRLVVRQFC